MGPRRMISNPPTGNNPAYYTIRQERRNLIDDSSGYGQVHKASLLYYFSECLCIHKLNA